MGQQLYRADCPCPKVKCKRHCYCDECRIHHGKKGRLHRCERSAISDENED